MVENLVGSEFVEVEFNEPSTGAHLEKSTESLWYRNEKKLQTQKSGLFITEVLAYNKYSS